jgi:lactoylglutathione lyase
MPRIAHVAIKVDDMEAATKFYEEVFGFTRLSTEKVRDHVSRHLTDGHIDVALIKYDTEDSSAEAKAAGRGPAIHHLGFGVDDIDGYLAKIKERGCEMISDPGVLPIKFRAPGGTIAEIAPMTHFKGGSA